MFFQNRSRRWFVGLAALTLVLVAAALQFHRIRQNELKNVWLDRDTFLMWVKRDNGFPINALAASNYCQSLTVGGISGWRLPRVDELDTLFESQATSFYYDADGEKRPYHIRENILLTRGYAWGANPKGKRWEDAYAFDFEDGNPNTYPGEDVTSARALCVHDAPPHGL